MFYRHLMKASYDPALQQGPEAVDPLSMDIAAHPLFVGMNDYFMFEPALRKVRVEIAFVRHHLCFGSHNRIDLLSDGPTIRGRNVLRNHAARFALDHSEHRFFVVLRSEGRR